MIWRLPGESVSSTVVVVVRVISQTCVASSDRRVALRVLCSVWRIVSLTKRIAKRIQLAERIMERDDEEEEEDDDQG